MQTHEESLRDQIALGWIILLLVGGFAFIFQIIRSLLTEADRGFRTLKYDPGVSGIKILVFAVALYALMPVYVSVIRSLRTRFFRWVSVALAALGVMFNVMHHLAHWQSGGKPDFPSHMLDITLHIVGVWVLVNSIRWSRIPAPAAVSRPTLANQTALAS